MRLIGITFILLLLTASTEAQVTDSPVRKRPYVGGELQAGVKELHIGDQVPDILIEHIINDDSQALRTSDYRDKLLILDFWDIYCGTCIESMPHVDALQASFGDRAKILSVTWMSEKDIIKFFANNKYVQSKNVHRATVVDDDLLRSHFPSRGLPHIVWINKGKVVAITDNSYLNKDNINAVLDGKPVDWPVKNESFDPSRPLMALTGLASDALNSPFYSHSVLTGMSNSLSANPGGINFAPDSARNLTRIALYNADPRDAYQMLLYSTKVLPTMEAIEAGTAKMPHLPHPSREVFEVKDSSRMLYKPAYGNLADWNRSNLFCYEIVKYGLHDEQSFAKLAVQDLNSKLGLNGRYEMRKVKCLVFVRTDKPITDTVAVASGNARDIASIVMLRLDMHRKYPPAIDETGFTGYLNMRKDDGTIDDLRKEIQRHGLDLIEAEREIECLVISDN